MGHDRNASLCEKPDRFSHAPSTFDLYGAAACLLQHARGVHEGLFLRFLVRTERHIDNDKSAPRTTHHCATLQDHHVECDRNSGFHSVHHHAEWVADQDDIAIFIDKTCCV